MRGLLRVCGLPGPRSAPPWSCRRGGSPVPCPLPPLCPVAPIPAAPPATSGAVGVFLDSRLAGSPQTASLPCRLTAVAAARRLLPGKAAAGPWGSPRRPARSVAPGTSQGEAGIEAAPGVCSAAGGGCQPGGLFVLWRLWWGHLQVPCSLVRAGSLSELML